MKIRNHHLIQIYEHQRLRIGESFDGMVFTQQHWEQLLRFHENQYPPYFQIIHQGIKALHYVGTINLPGLTLEILPKTDTDAHINWQLFLLDMLQACGKLPATKTPSLMSATQGRLHDFFIDAFLNEVEKLNKAGLLKKYRRENRNEHKFSGRILLHEHIRRNAVHKERVFAEHQVFDTRHILHEVLKEALNTAKRLSDHPETTHRLQQAARFFPATSKVDIYSLRKLKLCREDANYTQALQWANFILRHLSLQTKYGSLSTSFFMLDMQQLFEEYVAMQLKKIAPCYGCRIQHQAKSRFWKQRSIRPDMVLTTREGEPIILDTKWKMLKNSQPADADLKQIYIYNQFFSARRGILLYPGQHGMKNYAADYSQTKGSAISCELLFIELIDKNNQSLSAQWAKNILEYILEQTPGRN